MYDGVQEIRAKANTSDLNEELGQVGIDLTVYMILMLMGIRVPTQQPYPNFLFENLLSLSARQWRL